MFDFPSLLWLNKAMLAAIKRTGIPIRSISLVCIQPVLKDLTKVEGEMLQIT